MKQTAVEWLVNELENHHVFHDIKNTVVYQQAKEMHKQEIIDAIDDFSVNQWGEFLSGEEYYNETYETSNI
jgi:hypothetical protein